MRAVFLDTESLDDLDLSPIRDCVDELVCYRGTSPDQVDERIAGFELVIVNKVVLTGESIATADGLKLICVVATGVNNVDIKVACERNIPVCNAQGYGVTSVAQHVITQMLALHTHIIDYDRAVRAGDWARATQFCLLDYPIVEVEGRTLGIVGHGALGQAVGRLAEALGMRVIVSARIGSDDVPEGRVAFGDVVEQADVISLHCPLNDDTRNLFDADVLARMKPGAFLINAARGGIVNEQALSDALRSGHLGGAAVDVLTEEPPRNGNVLFADDIPNLILTPHCAWGSFGARSRIIEQTAENIHAYLDGRRVRCVNL
ncbi:D-3-phosphoglycerate dehydrogenase [Marinobacterium lacunae]|uniref:D-3-phosphoglycerate dehydrogenase n=1 Tax=Marinobacterium lacunae TaxID=1232683 RepID=A0A081FU37_9GAMM|nr:2-hydroxyacid dehydrogenase [Marinobacterium lacunae]KEA62042.1 D-3-phosphoglycerate dehydrogenase [Marinobacterium lacunae]